MSTSAVIGAKGQIVIPAALRKKYRLEPGATVAFREEQGHLVLEPNPYDAFLALEGSIDAPLLETLAAYKVEERLREDAC